LVLLLVVAMLRLLWGVLLRAVLLELESVLMQALLQLVLMVAVS
jgi:hypothetical protein